LAFSVPPFAEFRLPLRALPKPRPFFFTEMLIFFREIFPFFFSAQGCHRNCFFFFYPPLTLTNFLIVRLSARFCFATPFLPPSGSMSSIPFATKTFPTQPSRPSFASTPGDSFERISQKSPCLLFPRECYTWQALDSRLGGRRFETIPRAFSVYPSYRSFMVLFNFFFVLNTLPTVIISRLWRPALSTHPKIPFYRITIHPF